MHDKNIPEKSNLVLNWILIALVLIGMRVGYLGMIAHDDLHQAALKPRRKTLLSPPHRGTIRDRFDTPLAINKTHYIAQIRYDELRRIPSVKWMRNASGRKEKCYPRREYIQKLSSFLAQRLNIDATQIEDVIYSKASIFPNTPFHIKEGLSESEYFSLQFLEKDWPGLEMQISSKRDYPEGKMASHVLGYLGAIHETQYGKIAHERDALQQYVSEREEGFPAPLPKGYESTDQVRKRLKALQEKAYRFNDEAGRAGIEKSYDESLRGDMGRSNYEIDIKGRIKRELPGNAPPLPGKRVSLSLSTELQAFAEKLLIGNERVREENFENAGKNHNLIRPPWIKGGAIVAMLPKTGEIVAMASYPRFNPNDFTSKSEHLHQWLEDETYLASIWDGRSSLEREIINKQGEVETEKRFLTWDGFLDLVLQKKSSTRQAMGKIQNVERAIYLLNAVEMLASLSGNNSMPALMDALFLEIEGHIPSRNNTKQETIESIWQALEGFGNEVTSEISGILHAVPFNDDKLLVLDLCRLVIDSQFVTESLLKHIGSLSLSLFRKQSSALSIIEKKTKIKTEQEYYENIFPNWRANHFNEYLKLKREEERENNRYQKPYLDYLNEKKRELFSLYWQTNRLSLLQNALLHSEDDSHAFGLIKAQLNQIPEEEQKNFLLSLRTYSDLSKPLWGKYRLYKKGTQLQRHLASAFYPAGGFGHCKSYAYEQTAPLGSIFKIVTAYEALRQQYLRLISMEKPTHALNPLTIYDEIRPQEITKKGMILGYTLGRKPIPRIYKGGRLPKSHRSIGRIELLDAMEQSSNLYFSLLASDTIEQPTDLVDAARMFGFGEKTGIELFGEIPGGLPTDIRENRTGLYSLAIGQHSLSVTPLQTARMLSCIASGGVVLKPSLIHQISGQERANDLQALEFPYKNMLENIGVYFPLFQKLQPTFSSPTIVKSSAEILHELFMPREIQNTLITSLSRVTSGEHGAAHGSRIRALYGKHSLMRQYISLQKQMIGKTSTAEEYYRPTLEREAKQILSTHIWFGGISFTDETLQDPELVVTVFLRFGDFGKEAAPLAAQVISKWREIQSKEHY